MLPRNGIEFLERYVLTLLSTLKAGTTSVLLAFVKQMPGPLPEKQSVLNNRVLEDEEMDKRMKSTTKQNLRNRSGVS